jgi:GH25 family lysozyme M1 (1,4-beta-N-acetylmuramidase)
MSERFLVETANGMLNIHGVDVIRRESTIEWVSHSEDRDEYIGKKVYHLVATKQSQEIHRWTFKSKQERESALLTLRKEFDPLRIQFS